MKKAVCVFAGGQSGDVMTAMSVFKYRNEKWGDNHKIIWYINPENRDLLAYQDIELRDFPRGYGYPQMVIDENKKLVDEGKEPIWRDFQPLVDWDNRMNMALKFDYPELSEVTEGYFPLPHQMSPQQRHGLIYPEVSRKVFGISDTYEWHPVLAFSEEERFMVMDYMSKVRMLFFYPKAKIVAIETFAGSGQSKITDENIRHAMQICKDVLVECNFIFVSHKYLNGNESFPDDFNSQIGVTFCGHLTVRQCALVVAGCDLMISVSSGITVAASCWRNKNSKITPIIQFTGSRICSTELLALGRFELIRTDGRTLDEASEHFYSTLRLMLNEIK